ncbi:MAG: hypothetical protein BroJett030_24850 [Alphaproteobacteria bacterium]|nr:MAG: hypothetical protein BroJett030_24850 [Alphaproteobacteria bacterium]
MFRMRQPSSMMFGWPWLCALALIFVVVAMFAGDVAEARPGPFEDHVEQAVLMDAGDVTSVPDDHHSAACAAMHCSSGSGCLAFPPQPAGTQIVCASGGGVMPTEDHITRASPTFGLFRPPRRA